MGVSAAGLFFLRLLIRRGSRDLTEIKTEFSQIDYVKTLREDLDRAQSQLREQTVQWGAAMTENGHLRAQAEALRERIARLEAENQDLKKTK